MTLIKELEKKVVDSSSSLVEILLQMKVLASKLDNKEILDWINYELNGYSGMANEIPAHRKGACVNLGDILGPFWSRINGIQVPTNNLPQNLKEYASDIMLVEGVGTIEEMAKTGKSYMHPWPIELATVAAKYNLEEDYQYTRVWKPIEQPFIRHVLGCIRSKVLDIILELQKVNPAIENSDDEIKNIPRDKSEAIYKTVINATNVNLAIGSNNNLEMTVIQNDLESLKNYLKYLNIEKIKIDELEKSIKADDNKKGNKVFEWIGKFSDGIIKKGAEIGITKLVTIAIDKYFGAGI